MIRPEDILSQNRGILAADESNNTAGKRLAAVGLDNTQKNRANYRKMLLTAPCIQDYIGGVILFDETFHQRVNSDLRAPQFLKSLSISPGIKVDKGLEKMANGETLTTGLSDLDHRLEKYGEMGAEFAKWRAVIRIGKGIPTNRCIENNCFVLASYAKSCQNHRIIPVVEPETLMEGEHCMETCKEITSSVLQCLKSALKEENVDFKNLILKVNMVVEGSEHQKKADAHEVADSTLTVLKDAWDASHVVFLSGGQTELRATQNLQAINLLKGNSNHFPYALSFSYGRALQEAAMKKWNGMEKNVGAAQSVLLHRAKMNWLASQSSYSGDLEND